MGSVKTALLFGAGLLLTIAFITIGVQLFGTATEASKSATNDYANIQTELSEQKYLVYEGTTVSGSQILNALRRFEGEENFGVKIITGQNTGGTWYYNDASSADNVTDGSSDLSGTTNPASNQYVNPAGSFKSQIERDSNNVIRGIIFTQMTN